MSLHWHIATRLNNFKRENVEVEKRTRAGFLRETEVATVRVVQEAFSGSPRLASRGWILLYHLPHRVTDIFQQLLFTTRLIMVLCRTIGLRSAPRSRRSTPFGIGHL